MPARRLTRCWAPLLLVGALAAQACARTGPEGDAGIPDGPTTLTPDALAPDAAGPDQPDGDACRPVLGFKTCAEPIEVPAEGGRFCGDTSQTDNLYSVVVDPASGCDRPSPEPEYVFRFALTERATIEARARGDFRIALYLRSGCIDEATQIDCAQSVAAGDAAVMTRELEAGVYHLFVDGAGDPAGVGQNRGPFELSLQLR